MSTTTAEAGISRKWPRQRLLLALLVVSVALNLFFVAGAVWTRLRPPPEAADSALRFQRMASELDFDQRQRTAFDHYIAAMRARNMTMRQQASGLVRGALDELAKPDADAKQVARLLDEAADKRRQSVHEGITQTLDFLSLLSPAQRSKFFALARGRPSGWWRTQTQNR